MLIWLFEAMRGFSMYGGVLVVHAWQCALAMLLGSICMLIWLLEALRGICMCGRVP